MAVSPSNPSSRVELSISCSNLQDKDVFSKSDPIAVIYVKGKGDRYSEVRETRVYAAWSIVFNVIAAISWAFIEHVPHWVFQDNHTCNIHFGRLLLQQCRIMFGYSSSVYVRNHLFRLCPIIIGCGCCIPSPLTSATVTVSSPERISYLLNTSTNHSIHITRANRKATISYSYSSLSKFLLNTSVVLSSTLKSKIFAFNSTVKTECTCPLLVLKGKGSTVAAFQLWFTMCRIGACRVSTDSSV